MKKIRVFIDSDVIISSLISTSGAAYLLLNQSNTENYISNISQKELEKVAHKLGIGQDKLNTVIKHKLKKVQLKQTLEEIKTEFIKYTSDVNDAHILMGAKNSGARFLISYNLKDYKIEKIHQDFKITILTPARFIQYLRSLASSDLAPKT